jgi:hypothetical protein
VGKLSLGHDVPLCLPYSLAVRIGLFHSLGPGSTPGMGRMSSSVVRASPLHGEGLGFNPQLVHTLIVQW